MEKKKKESFEWWCRRIVKTHCKKRIGIKRRETQKKFAGRAGVKPEHLSTWINLAENMKTADSDTRKLMLETLKMGIRALKKDVDEKYENLAEQDDEREALKAWSDELNLHIEEAANWAAVDGWSSEAEGTSGVPGDRKNLEALYGELEARDLFVFVSFNVTPLEFRDPNLWRQIAGAVKRGAFFLYLFPGDGLTNQINHEWGIKIDKTSKSRRDQVADFIDAMKDNDNKDVPFEKRICCDFIEACPFFMYGETIGIFWLVEPGTNREKCYVSQRLADGQKNGVPLFLETIDNLFVSELKKVVTRVCHKIWDDDLPAVVPPRKAVDSKTSPRQQSPGGRSRRPPQKSPKPPQ